MRRISAGAIAVFLGIGSTSARGQAPPPADPSVERAIGKPDAVPAPARKPATESELALTAVHQKRHALDEAIKAKDPKDKAAERVIAR